MAAGSRLDALLTEIASRLRGLLDPRVTLRVETSKASSTRTPVDPGQIEAAVTEMVRRVQDAMPRGGILTLQAHLGRAPSRDALLPAVDGEASAGWLVVAAGSAEAHVPDLRWDVAPPRADLACLARQAGGGLSLSHSPGAGAWLRLHLPCEPSSMPRPAEPPECSVANPAR